MGIIREKSSKYIPSMHYKTLEKYGRKETSNTYRAIQRVNIPEKLKIA